MVRLDVECDGCRKVESIQADSPELAGQKLDELGWLRNGSRDQDICPDCFHGRAGFNVPRVLL
jgi:hypothetical protein